MSEPASALDLQTDPESLSTTDRMQTRLDEITESVPEEKSRMKLYFILGGGGLLLLFIVMTVILYSLGGEDESALERLQSIAVIYIVFISMIIVILMAATTAAMIYLAFQIRDKVLPMLGELTTTMSQVKGTTQFMSDEAVKPVISVAGRVAQWRAMVRVVTGAGKKRQ